ncbi:MAG: HD domain-containing protein [Candidatus Micrarchaeota archaeon]|nr:HD domain-containing protein [Candidatus Micrarchaeota archaeon]
MQDDFSNITKYLFEAGTLKRVKRSGWWLAGIKDPESVAEHSFRTAVVAFVLAKLECQDDSIANKICSAAVFHDIHECRILDVNKVAAKYIDKQEVLGSKVEQEQIAMLPNELKQSVNHLYNLSEREKTILKDADLLEMALQAKEYLEIGYTAAEEWLVSIEKRLKTPTAKKLMDKIKTMKSTEWYANLKKLD